MTLIMQFDPQVAENIFQLSSLNNSLQKKKKKKKHRKKKYRFCPDSLAEKMMETCEMSEVLII